MVIRPPAVKDAGFEIVRTGDGAYLIRGEKPSRWVAQTDFTNDEAVGYLADRLARLGVEEALAKAGAERRRHGADRRPRRRGRLRLGPGTPGGRRSRARPARLGLASGKMRPCSDPARHTPAHRRRPDIAGSPRTVVKIGSSSLTTKNGAIDDARIAALTDAIAARASSGHQVLLVSSGAIATGMAPLGLQKRPKDLATQQAAASVGQGLLIARYTEAFSKHGLGVGQVLLTADDLMRRAHYRNAQRTLDRLLELGIVPVINENDTVATDEIRFGDNDRLAALVAHVSRASALILLSDVDGLYDGDPRKGDAQQGRRGDRPA